MDAPIALKKCLTNADLSADAGGGLLSAKSVAQSQHPLRSLAWIGVLLLVLAGCRKPAAGAATIVRTTVVTVSAASSLTEVLTDIAKDFEAENPAIRIDLNFGSSGALLKQIEQGAPVDAFISASPDEMAVLDKKGITVAHTELASNEVVCIVPGNSQVVDPTPGFDWSGLSSPVFKKIAMADPAVAPLGRYSRQVLQKHGVLAKISERLILAETARQTLAYVERGDVDAGFVFATDAKMAGDKVRVVATAKVADHDPILYIGASIMDRPSTGYATYFLQSCHQKKARDTFAKYGFLPVPGLVIVEGE